MPSRKPLPPPPPVSPAKGLTHVVDGVSRPYSAHADHSPGAEDPFRASVLEMPYGIVRTTTVHVVNESASEVQASTGEEVPTTVRRTVSVGRK